MENNKQIPYTTLSYWPEKEFEIVGVVKTGYIDKKTSNVDVTFSPFGEFKSYTRTRNRESLYSETTEVTTEVDIKINIDNNLLSEIDAIIDLKPVVATFGISGDTRSRIFWVGTAIKFKK